MFLWASKKQEKATLPSAEDEYVSASMATSQAIWLRRILEDIGEPQMKANPLMCDNKLAIDMTKNPVYHSRTKHIFIKHQFIRDAIEDEEVEIQYLKTEDQVANIFTKVFPRNKFQYFRELLGVQNMN